MPLLFYSFLGRGSIIFLKYTRMVSRIPVAGLGFHSQELLYYSNSSNHNIYALSFANSEHRSTAPLIGTEGGDSCGNSTCLKTPESGFLEEAEAVPAESVRLQWKSTVQRIYKN